MDALDRRGLIAEISATCSGFFAVFPMFSRADGRFSPGGGNFVRAMILSTLDALLFALLPRVLSLLLSPELLQSRGAGCATWTHSDLLPLPFSVPARPGRPDPSWIASTPRSLLSSSCQPCFTRAGTD